MKKRLATIYLSIVLVVGIGFALMPILPRILELFKDDSTVTFPYPTRLLETAQAVELPTIADKEIVSNQDSALPDGKRLVIPTAGIDAPIVQGNGDYALSRGIWDQRGSPTEGGNTVLSGHRWQYRPPNNNVSKNLYWLDKVEVGDTMIVYWDGAEFDYRVKEIAVVTTDQVDILRQTDENLLTIYTCAPLFSTSKRLVVIGELI